MTKFNKFLISIGLQVGIIFLIIISKLLIIGSGTEVLLKIKPVDPRDPLRGDYVTFSYYISTITSYRTDSKLQRGDVAYVILTKSSNYWRATTVQSNKPDSNQIFLRGTIKNINTIKNSNTVYTLEYGIEDYFIPENSGRTLTPFRNDIYARVVIDKNGYPVLKGLVVDGKPWP